MEKEYALAYFFKVVIFIVKDVIIQKLEIQMAEKLEMKMN
jgi:hypothetical protein